MKIKEIFTNIILAAEIAVLYISAIFINKIISDKYNLLLSLLYTALTAAIYALALISKNKKEWLLK